MNSLRVLCKLHAAPCRFPSDGACTYQNGSRTLYAVLAAAAYRGKNAPQALLAARNEGYAETGMLSNKDVPEYFGRVFEKGNEIVVAYAGTELDTIGDAIGDWQTNLVQGTGFVGAQYKQAIRDAKKIVKNNPGKRIRFVGHSLGGGLASAAASAVKRKAITFNASGVHRNTNFPVLVNDRKIRAYRVQGDPLSNLQQEWGGVLVPNGNGREIWLPTNRLGLDDVLYRHGMDAIIAGMDEMINNPQR